MKTEASKRKNSVITIILAAVMILLCLFTAFTVIPAKADGGDSAAPDTGDDGGTPPEAYYFSDYEGSAQLCSDLITNGIVNAIECKYWQHDVFEDEFRKAFYDGEFDDISDTHVIFEIRYGFNMEIQSDLNLVFVLRDFFSDLKSKNCRIMFICGTDGYRLSNVNEFLDYVDIHVDTDLLFTFVSSILYHVFEDCGYKFQISNCTFLIDNNFAISGEYADNTGNAWFKSRFFRDYFLAYIKSVYKTEIDGCGKFVVNIFEKNNIKVLYNTLGTEYIDVVKMQTSPSDPYAYINDYDQFYIDYMSGQHVYAIGCASFDQSFYNEWINNLQNLQSNTFEFPVYVYDAEANYSVDDDVLVSGKIDEREICDMIADFIMDADLSVYDNYSGRCIVTHKMLKSGPDGWMVNVGGDDGNMGLFDFFIEGWLVFMNEYDYEYYTRNDNIYPTDI